MIEIALLVISLTSDGAHRLTLTPAENLAACEDSKLAVTGILASAGIEVVAARCGENNLHLTPFEHGASAEEEVYKYRVVLAKDGGFTVEPLSDVDCQPTSDALRKVYCVRSSQSVVE
ncbi:hypothetical protein N4R57_11150 [Rhodobacteraceae bacterium D3-12]|nr:hypothetical protein N4R57_11150 [Rhodobacteraceae bacterium D3-12]